MAQNIDRLKRKRLLSFLSDATFGVEIEEHRVQLSTQSLSRYSHSNEFGSRRFNPYFQTDFSESQEELVTAPHSSSAEALAQLHELQMILASTLEKDEVVWPLSMPPHLENEDVDYLLTHFERPWYQKYRDYLTQKYGPYQHIMTGVHVSMSLPDELIYLYSGQNKLVSFVDAKNRLYFQIAKHIAAYRWLFTFLFGASPLTENQDDKLVTNHPDIEPVRSWRSSSLGFTNQSHDQIQYLDFESYIKQIDYLVENHHFYEQSEFYGPVRLKGKGAVKSLVDKGTDYLEFRIFDTDPFSIDGISQRALDFLHLMVIDSVVNSKDWTREELHKSEAWNDDIALVHPSELIKNDEILAVYEDLITRLSTLLIDVPDFLKSRFKEAIDYLTETLSSPRLTVGGRLQKKISHGSLSEFALYIGKNRAEQLKKEFDYFISKKDSLNRTYAQALKLGIETEKINHYQLYLKFGDRSQLIDHNVELSNYFDQNKDINH
ncbi:glutamate--cysteine ligase [Leuconostoc falkenbergense]